MRHNQLAASITFNRTPDAIMTAFQAIERWSEWYPGVVGAHWIVGEAWEIGAVMEVRVRNSLGMLVGSTATVLPVGNQILGQDALEGSPDPGRDLAIPPAHFCCWENRAPGLVTVCYAWAEATAQGSRFTLQKHYSGLAVPLLWLMKGRQAWMVQEALENLQRNISSAVRG
ncbi:MAG: SRPBCC family protein [Caldilineaceae bacterium]